MTAALAAFWMTCAGGVVVAQAPVADAPAAEQPADPPPPAAATGEIYTYRPDGRRDPFVSLLARGVDTNPEVRNLTGLGALTTAEVSVRGVIELGGDYVAMVQGPDAKTYIVHPNDRLLDGVITRITSQGLIILQEVNDPLSLVKQREVQKNLRAAEETQ